MVGMEWRAAAHVHYYFTSRVVLARKTFDRQTPILPIPFDYLRNAVWSCEELQGDWHPHFLPLKQFFLDSAEFMLVIFRKQCYFLPAEKLYGKCLEWGNSPNAILPNLLLGWRLLTLCFWFDCQSWMFSSASQPILVIVPNFWFELRSSFRLRTTW